MIIPFVAVFQVNLDNRVMRVRRQCMIKDHLPLRRNGCQDDVIRGCSSGINHCTDHLNFGMITAGHSMNKDGWGAAISRLRCPDACPVLLNRAHNCRPPSADSRAASPLLMTAPSFHHCGRFTRTSAGDSPSTQSSALPTGNWLATAGSSLTPGGHPVSVWSSRRWTGRSPNWARNRAGRSRATGSSGSS